MDSPSADLASYEPEGRPDDADGVQGGEAPSTPSVRATLVALSDHSKGRRAAARARRLFLRDAQISFVVAAWTVLLSTPVIVWPLTEKLWDMGCVELVEYDKCVARDYCHWSWSIPYFWKGSCQTSRRGFLSLWGAMILQFVFSVYTDFGNSIKFTLQGAFGTFLAWVNVALLNNVLAPVLGGGAHADSLVLQHKTSFLPQNLPVNSRWLPLCNDGFRVLTGDGDALCFMNLWLDEVSVAGLLKASLVWADFILFVVACLHVGFDSNTRMFALSTHVYFMMAFVNPDADDFSRFPTTADIYCLMIFVASVAAILCFQIPKRRFTAAEAAGGLAEEAADAAGLLLESLHSAPTQLMRQKARSALEETKVALADLQAALDAAWFEDFGFGAAAVRRRELKGLARALRACLRHVPAAQHAAEALTPEDAQALEQHVPQLRSLCAAARDLVLGLAHRDRSAGGDEGRPEGLKPERRLGACHAELAAAFEEAQGSLSGKACAFLLAVVGVAADADAAAVAARSNAGPPWRHLGCCQRVVEVARIISCRFGLRTGDHEATHPRFVLRNTFSISIAFLIGWSGLWNVLPAYSSYPSSTICVIFYTYAGSSAPVTVRRVAGVVIGKVIGTAIQLGFAVKSVVKASCFAVSMWMIVGCMFFMYLHAGKEMEYVCCLAAAFAASCMIPGDCRFREWGDSDYRDVIPGLMSSIVSTVIGVAILTLVDWLFASKATNQARQRLLRAVKRAERLVAGVAIRGEAGRNSCAARAQRLMEDVDALREVLPFAVAEPMYWRPPFKAELYEALEQHLRTLADHVEALCWAAAGCGKELTGDAAPAEGAGGGAAASGGGAASTSGSAGQSSLPDELPAAAELVAVLQRLQSEVVAMLESIAELAASVTQSSRHDEGAEEVRRQLQASLYTVKAMRLIAAGASNSMGRVFRSMPRQITSRRGLTLEIPESSSESTLLPSGASTSSVAGAGTSRLRAKVASLYHQVVHEELRPDGALGPPPAPAAGAAAEGGAAGSPQGPRPALEELVERLREAAARRRSPSPAADGPCRVELVTLFANSVLLEAQRMQLALLEY